MVILCGYAVAFYDVLVLLTTEAKNDAEILRPSFRALELLFGVQGVWVVGRTNLLPGACSG